MLKKKEESALGNNFEQKPFRPKGEEFFIPKWNEKTATKQSEMNRVKGNWDIVVCSFSMLGIFNSDPFLPVMFPLGPLL